MKKNLLKRKSMRYFIRIATILPVIVALALFATQNQVKAENNAENPAAQINALSTSVDDLRQAGFLNGKLQPPTVDGKYAGATYFWVNEGAETASSTKNLLMISEVPVPNDFHALFAYGSTNKTVSLSGTAGSEWSLTDRKDNRVAVNFVKNNFYVVIIGPEATKIEKLAGLLSEKI